MVINPLGLKNSHHKSHDGFKNGNLTNELLVSKGLTIQNMGDIIDILDDWG